MKNRIAILLGLTLMVGTSARPQNLDSLIALYVAEYDSAGLVYFKPNTVMPGQLYQMYQLVTGDTLHKLVLKKQWTDSMLGMQHYRYQETFRNLRVEGAEYSEHANQDGYLVFANGKVAQFESDMTARPTYSEEAALNNLLATMPDHYFAWMDADMEQDLKNDLGDSNATYYPDGELLWALDDYRDLGWNIPVSKYRLAWRFEILSLAPSFYKAFYVDAYTGEIFREEELIHTDGPANILTQGTKIIDTKRTIWPFWRKRYILRANDNHRKIHTKYLQWDSAGYMTRSWSRLPQVEDDDDNWGYSHQKATTAHWMVTQAWDFFASSPYKRRGPSGRKRIVRVWVDTTGVTKSAYYYYDARDNIVFGEWINGGYFAVVDVAGHEYTHGVIQYTSNLVYAFEPGALNESFADIFGFMVERFAEGGVSDWLIGEDVDTLAIVRRSLSNPKSMGMHSLGQNNCDSDSIAVGQPDTYKGTFWYNGGGQCDRGGVHINSGVQNFWFYLLANGGTGVNDNGDSYNIQGIGIDKAAKIAYWNMTDVLQRASQYSDARAGAIAAARMLFGHCSNEEIQTTNAWAAVGVGNQSNCGNTGMSDFAFQAPRLFPNPATDEVTISFSQPRKRIIHIYSGSGALIKTVTSQREKEIRINTGNFPVGVYFVKVVERNQCYVTKLIKH